MARPLNHAIVAMAKIKVLHYVYLVTILRTPNKLGVFLDTHK